MHELIINLITIDIMHSEVIKKSLLKKIFHANSKKKKDKLVSDNINFKSKSITKTKEDIIY